MITPVTPQTNNNMAFQRLTYSSPLPPPEILDKSEKIKPGMIDELIKMTVVQSEHRRELESKKLDSEIYHMNNRNTEAKYGILCAFLLSVLSILAGVYTALHGAQMAGGVIGVSGGITIIICAFIRGRKIQ